MAKVSQYCNSNGLQRIFAWKTSSYSMMLQVYCKQTLFLSSFTWEKVDYSYQPLYRNNTRTKSAKLTMSISNSMAWLAQMPSEILYKMIGPGCLCYSLVIGDTTHTWLLKAWFLVSCTLFPKISHYLKLYQHIKTSTRHINNLSMLNKFFRNWVCLTTNMK